MTYQIKWLYWYNFEGTVLSNEPIVGLLGPKMTNISQFPIETKVYLNDFSSDIFKCLNVDNQMSQSCGQDEPLGCQDNAFLAV